MVACDGVSKHPGVAVAAVGAMLYGGFAAIDRVFLGRRFNLLEAKKLLPGGAVLVALGLIGEGVAYSRASKKRAGEELAASIAEVALTELAGAPLLLTSASELHIEQFLFDEDGGPKEVTNEAIIAKAKEVDNEHLYGLVKHANREQFKVIWDALEDEPEKLVIILKALAQEVYKNKAVTYPFSEAQEMKIKLGIALPLTEGRLSFAVITTIHPECLIPRLQEAYAEQPVKLKELAKACDVDRNKFNSFVNGASSPEPIEVMMTASGNVIAYHEGGQEAILKALCKCLSDSYLQYLSFDEDSPEAALKERHFGILTKALKEYSFALSLKLVDTFDGYGVDVQQAIKDHVADTFFAGGWQKDQITPENLENLFSCLAGSRGAEFGKISQDYFPQLVKLARAFRADNKLNSFDSIMRDLFDQNMGKISDSGVLLDVLNLALDVAKDKDVKDADWTRDFERSFAVANFDGWDEVERDQVIEKAKQLCEKLEIEVPNAYRD